ncbi:MAG: DUF2442 domain-containing protein [Candidatus Marinimicrobia bacterium]|jgi:hypothetical protein|nr:DUF2442 domain-containing protein [Candidatus Neomarinimicrobiota bacterium]
MFLHVIDAKYIEKYRVKVLFNDGREGVADLSEALTGAVFEPLRDESEFSLLRVDEELETIVWSNGADLAPEYIYYQAFKGDPDLQEQFKVWGYLASDFKVSNSI